MKVSLVIFCLAFVPFALAQEVEHQTEERSEPTLLGRGVNWLWDFVSDKTDGRVTREQVVEDSKAKLDKGLELIEDGINGLVDDLRLHDVDTTVPRADLPSADQIFEKINTAFNNFKESINNAVDNLQERIQKQEPEQEPEQEPVQETVQLSFDQDQVNFWNNWFTNEEQEAEPEQEQVQWEGVEQQEQQDQEEVQQGNFWNGWF